MVEQVLEIQGEARDVVSGLGFVGGAVAAEIGDDYMVVLGEGSDVALEDCPGACEAVELSRHGQVGEQRCSLVAGRAHQDQRGAFA